MEDNTQHEQSGDVPTTVSVMGVWDVIDPYLIPSKVPPRHDLERTALVVKFVILTVVLLFVVPKYALSGPSHERRTTSANGGIESPDNTTKTATTRQRRRVKRKTTNKRSPYQANKESERDVSAKENSGQSETTTMTATPENQSDGGVDTLSLLALNLMWLVSSIALVLHTSNNVYSAQSTFQVPLLSPEECNVILSAAHRAASVNHANATAAAASRGATVSTNILSRRMANRKNQKPETVDLDSYGNDNDADGWDPHGYLREPLGWQKKRHGSYPTVDLNLVTDPFTDDDRAFLGNILTARLAPMIERVYGVAPAAIRANDMFVVRYDAAPGHQASLVPHTDSSDLSFNVLLNDDFEDGGTRFHRLTDPKDGVVGAEEPEPKSYVVQPRIGDALLHNSALRHEGVTITSGRRYVLVGFLDLDRNRPSLQDSASSSSTYSSTESAPTGLSSFASLWSIPWILKKTKAGYNLMHDPMTTPAILDNPYGRALLRDILLYLTLFLDAWAPHRHLVLSDDDQREGLLRALDDQRQKRNIGGVRILEPSWFGGQHIDLDMFGSLHKRWNSRLDVGDEIFRDL